MWRLILSAGTVAAGSSNGGIAACAAQFLQQRCFSSSGPAAASAPAAAELDINSLTPEQQQHVKVLQYLVQRPLQAAHNAAMLTALTASYRDLYIVMDQLHKKDILGIPRPLTDEPPLAQAGSSNDGSSSGKEQQPVTNHTQMVYPVRDLTKLPDEPAPIGGWLRNHLSERYMTRITAYAQLLPNHLEVSYQTASHIFLWPPMEAYIPGLLDIEGALRYLKPSFKRAKRSPKSQKLKQVRCKLGYRRKSRKH